MTVEASQTNTSAEHSHHEADADVSRELTTGIVSLAFGLTALLGGGILSNAVQLWTLQLTSRSGGGSLAGSGLLQIVTSLPAIVLGSVAIALGLAAARSINPVAGAVGKAGAVVGCLALVGGALYAVAIYNAGVMY